jgi:hypothetical protein
MILKKEQEAIQEKEEQAAIPAKMAQSHTPKETEHKESNERIRSNIQDLILIPSLAEASPDNQDKRSGCSTSPHCHCLQSPNG